MIPKQLWQAARNLDDFLNQAGYRYCLIGGIAIQRWGEPRMTTDVDATVFAQIGSERPVISALLTRYQARIPDALDFALQARVLLLQDLAGCPLDIGLGCLDFEDRMLVRSSVWGTPGHGRIRTCSAEDLVVLKAFANRPQDWIDIERVIIRQGPRLDRQLILQELTPLAELKEDPQILQDLLQLLSLDR